jgi:hypothetical protein
MIVRLIPDQIAKFWELIKGAIAASVSKEYEVSGNLLNNSLKNLLTGTSQAWLVMDEQNGKPIVGVVVTYITDDPMGEQRNLVIYALFGFQIVDDSIWLDGIDKLKEFARANGCKQLVGYTTSRILENRITKYGFVNDSSIVRLEV